MIDWPEVQTELGMGRVPGLTGIGIGIGVARAGEPSNNGKAERDERIGTLRRGAGRSPMAGMEAA
jgi:hypothetical protein